MSDQCPICLENIQNELRLSHCQHTFCRECIEEWFKSSTLCPVCRQTSLEAENIYHEHNSDEEWSDDSSDNEDEPVTVLGFPDYNDGFNFWVRGITHQLLREVAHDFLAAVDLIPIANVPMIGIAHIDNIQHIRWTIIAQYLNDWMPQRWLEFYAVHARQRTCGYTYERLIRMMNGGRSRVLLHVYPNQQPPFPLYICRRCRNFAAIFSHVDDLQRHNEIEHRRYHQSSVLRILFGRYFD